MGRMVILVGGEPLERWNNVRLSRKKKDLTGSLSIDIFFDYLPDSPVMVNSFRGQEVLAYIDGHLAFTGRIDKRKGSNKKQKKETVGDDGTVTAQVSDKGYSVSLTARGKTKYLIGGSHQHPNGDIRQSNNKAVAGEIIRDYDIEIDWKAKEIDLDRFTLIDGGRPVDELHRLCNENCHFIYETRDGKLRICDETLEEYGTPLILGQNILEFDAEQSEDDANSEIRIKGHRAKEDEWGESAVIDRQRVIKDKWVQSFSPITLEHYGDASDEALERRAKWEADTRAAQSKSVKIKLFDVAARDGTPYDLGLMHYVEIPPEGIYDVMECTEIEISASDTDVNTTLTLSPPPSKSISGAKLYEDASGNSLLNPANVLNEFVAFANSRKAASGLNYAGDSYPQSWGSADLSVMPTVIPDIVQAAVNVLLDPQTTSKKSSPPLRLPNVSIRP